MLTPAIQTDNATVYCGNNLEILPTLPDNSVDSIITDPPYELGFMSKTWDKSGIAYSVELWKECLRVLKPGGHLLAFGGSRTWHRLAVAIEDAGFEMRDSIAWLYGSGFPKSHNISKAIDKMHGAEREIVGKHIMGSGTVIGIAGNNGKCLNCGKFKGSQKANCKCDVHGKPITDDAKKWDGWGTALKPAFEPVVVARKPLIGTVAENVLQFGVGGLNIDASRIAGEDAPEGRSRHGGGIVGNATSFELPDSTSSMPAGRWPANVILDETTAELLDEQTGASRFFYVAKASKRDRNEGLDEFPEVQTTGGGGGVGDYLDDVNSASGKYGSEKAPAKNFHPTVKPTTLMTYLIKLVTPKGGIVLDPFTGSGSTGKAAILEDYKFIGIELTAEYLPIIEGRLKHAEQTKEAEQQDDLFS